MLSAIVLNLFAFISSGDAMAIDYKPVPVPAHVRVVSSEPRISLWNSLTSKEKNLAKYLMAAGNAGKTILLNQRHRHGVLIRDVLTESLNTRNLLRTKRMLGEGFNEYLAYSAKFFDVMSPYTYGNRKYVLSSVTLPQMLELFERYAPEANPQARLEAARLLADPTYEVIFKPENEDGKDLEISGNNIYQKGITGKEVDDALAAGLKPDLNCRIVRNSSGGLKCEVQALSNPEIQPVVREALTEVVKNLTSALPYATTEHQANQIRYLIQYLNSGDIEDFRKMNIEWVKDGTNSKVDFMMGFVESYFIDYRAQIAEWESYVQFIDPELTNLSVKLAAKAQTFEDQMPYGVYKKKFPKGYSPPALMAYYFQEVSGIRSGGYNLPNFDDIRRDVGAKNIIRVDLPGQDKDTDTLRLRREIYTEFMPASEIEETLKYWPKSKRIMTILHEIIGHGSGTYNTQKYGPKEDPTTALGSLGSSLEEQRADLTGLLFAADPSFVEVGIFKDEAEALSARRAFYNTYLANFLRDISTRRTLTGAHHRGHWLLINHLLEAGAIAKVSRDGSTLTDDVAVYVVHDDQKFYEVCRNLLAKLQRIKAEREVEELKELYAKYAPLEPINSSWFQKIIARGDKLEANSGYVEQPWSLLNDTLKVHGTLTLEGIASFLHR